MAGRRGHQLALTSVSLPPSPLPRPWTPSSPRALLLPPLCLLPQEAPPCSLGSGLSSPFPSLTGPQAREQEGPPL